MVAATDKDPFPHAAPVEPTPIMQGELSTVSLADVLQLMAGRGGRHEVEIYFEGGVGKVYLEGESLHRADVLGDEELEGVEALRFLLGLEGGRFEVREPVVWPEANLSGPVQAMLIEAARLMDESEPAFSFNEEIFEEELRAEVPARGALERLKERLPEVDFLVRLSPEGELLERAGAGEAEELAGLVSYVSLQLREMGEILDLGALRGFAVSGKRRLWAALFEDEGTVGMTGAPVKGLPVWCKKMVSAAGEEGS